jgi:hydrogenase expression/formation protein HypE
MKKDIVNLAHGNGGRPTRELIHAIFARQLANPALDVEADAVNLALDTTEIVLTTDSFIVQPLEFPGGDIGSLAVHGTVNDLAVAGALPLYLSLNVIIEEGLEIERLTRIAASIGRAARESAVAVVCGDTKVVPRGNGGGLYLATTGIGRRIVRQALTAAAIQPGDAILVSGPPGEHGIAVLLAREEFDLQSAVASDSASVLPLTHSIADLDGLRFMRDPTRGGLATLAADIARVTSLNVELDELAIPKHPQVEVICEMLGFDMYHLASEGRVVAVIEAAQAQTALAAWRARPEGRRAAIIGRVSSPDEHGGAGMVILRTAIGGERVLEELEHDPLPRIC